MVEYADFFVLIATLAPVFFLAGLIAHYRIGRAETERLTRAAALVALGLNALLTAMLVALPLLVLGGFLELAAPGRLVAVIGLVFQLLISVWMTVEDTAREGRARPRGKRHR